MFNFSFFIFSITTLFLIFASFFDIRKRMIPNYLVFWLFLIGFFIKGIQAIVFNDFNIFSNALLSFIITLVVCYIFWEIGFFAGGDLKLFSAIAILNPFNINFLAASFSFGVVTTPVFALSLILVSVLCVAPVLILQSIYLFIFKQHYMILWNLIKSKNTLLSLISSTLVLFLISSFLNIFSLSIPFILYLLLSILFIYFFKQIEKYYINYYYYIILSFYLLLIIGSFWVTNKIFYLKDFLIILITIFILFIGITIYKIIVSKILTEEKPLSQLKEGDVTLNCYYKVNSKVIEKKVSFFNFIKMTINNTYTKNLIIDSRKIGGLSLKDITFLKSSYNHNLDKQIVLKKTIPFTPAVLCAYIVLSILGDFIWFLF